MFIKWSIVLLGIGVLSACVVVPTGPNVMVLPGPGKPFEAFQTDETVCRQYARYQLGVEPAEAASQRAVTSSAVGAVVARPLGHSLVLESGILRPAQPLEAGVASSWERSGVQASGASAATLQSRYDSDVYPMYVR
jgi:hypothetical protein